jgi:hypothetical protein
MFEDKIVDFEPSAGSIPLVGATIVVGLSDYPGIIRAAKDLARDFGRVTKGDSSPVVLVTSQEDYAQINTKTAILIGSVGSSFLVKRLVENGKLNTEAIDGKWESFTTSVLNEQVGACEQAMIIAGSDKRGTIFGVYTLSEQIGVSP